MGLILFGGTLKATGKGDDAAAAKTDTTSATTDVATMGPEGKVLALDVSEEFTSIARRHWAKAGIADRVELRLRPAAESLQELVAAGAGDTFDFAFIDADKVNYDTYYEYALKLVRRGGLIAIDNVLWSGQVADPSDDTPDTVAIRTLNKKVHGDERVDAVLVPIGDGLTLALKR